MVVALQALLILVVGFFVFAPLVRLHGQRIVREAASANQQRSIGERKTRLYTQLVELDFDAESGKMSTEDHARMREETMQEVLAVLAEEERLGLASAAPLGGAAADAAGHAGGPDDRLERNIGEMKRRRASMVASA
jgi:cytochrome c-type biogenesis protein CcmI